MEVFLRIKLEEKQNKEKNGPLGLNCGKQQLQLSKKKFIINFRKSLPWT